MLEEKPVSRPATPPTSVDPAADARTAASAAPAQAKIWSAPVAKSPTAAPAASKPRATKTKTVAVPSTPTERRSAPTRRPEPTRTRQSAAEPVTVESDAGPDVSEAAPKAGPATTAEPATTPSATTATAGPATAAPLAPTPEPPAPTVPTARPPEWTPSPTTDAATRVPVMTEPAGRGPATVEPILDQNAIAQPVSDQPIAAAELSPGASRAGRNLPVAISVGVGLAFGIVVSLVVYRPAFLLVLTAAVLVSLWELRRALASVGVRPPAVPLALGSVAMIAVTWLTGLGGLAVSLTLTVLAVLVWRISDGPVGYFRDISTGILITLYVPLLACMAVLMLRPDDGVARVVTFILTVVCSDIGGYAAGVLFGRHAMSPTVSPKKSWEGLAGSVVACMIAGTFLVSLALEGAWWQGALYGIAIALTATVGDLGESIIKRDLGIKDMGNLLPGHGGLMDRMDSLLPSAAVAYLLLAAFVPQVLS